MKFSLLIAAIILGIAALIAVPRQQKIKTLTTEWTELEAQAAERGVPIDPKVPFSSDRIRSGSSRVAREEKVNDFADELVAFYHKMKTLEKEGKSGRAENMKEIAEIIEKMSSFSPAEIRVLVKIISADGSIEQNSKLELIGFSTMMMASDNPESALAISLEARESLGAKSEEHDAMLQMILQQYAAKDPVSAAQWLSDNEDKMGEIDKGMKHRLVAAASKQDIGQAIGMIQTLKLGDDNSAYGSVASGVNSDNADTFIAALRDSDASDDQRAHALRALAGSELLKDFKTATEWLEGGLNADELKTFTNSLHYHNVKDEPEKWLSWLASNEQPSEDESEATKNIIAGWTRADFAATGEWLNSQPDGDLKDQSVYTYAQTLAEHEPAAAADWALTLTEGENRNALLKDILRSYEQKDPEAAAAFAEKHGVLPK